MSAPSTPIANAGTTAPSVTRVSTAAPTAAVADMATSCVIETSASPAWFRR